MRECFHHIPLAAAMLLNYWCWRKQQITNTMLNLAGSLLYKTTSKSCNFCNWKWIIYSAHRHWCNKLHRKAKSHNSSWRAQLYFEIFSKLTKQIPADYQAEWVSNEINKSKTLSALFCYSRAVDSTLLTTLSAISARQSNGTQAVTNEACTNCSAPQHWHLLPHLQHDSCCPHWRFLFLQNWWKKQDSGTLLIHSHTQSFPNGI